jgi:hypothetical protein
MNTNLGGQNDVNMSVIFVTGHEVPTTGAISVFFPAEMESNDAYNLYTIGSSCTLVGFSGGVSTC